MSDIDFDSYLSSGGPLDMGLDVIVLNSIARDLFLEEHYSPGEVVAKLLNILVSAEIVGRASKPWNGYQLGRDEISSLVLGFGSFILTVQQGYLSVISGIDKYRSWQIEYKKENPPLSYDYLTLAFGLLGNDPWGIDYSNLVAQTELDREHDLYFKLGIELGRRLFTRYVTIIKSLGLYEMVNSKIEINISKLHNILETIPVAQNNNFPGTLLATRRKQITQETINKYLDIHLEKALNEITAASQKELTTTTTNHLRELWENLLIVSGLKEHFALYTALHLSYAQFLEQTYEVTGKRELLKRAQEVYFAPLITYSIWVNDPGTRYICAFRSINLLIEKGDVLGVSTNQLTDWLYKYSFDAIQTNTRMFINSTYDESKISIQARIDDIIAVYLEIAIAFSSANTKFSMQWSQWALKIIESNKSKLLNFEISMSNIKTPLEPRSLYDAERKCLESLSKIRKRQHLPFQIPDYDSGLEDLNVFSKIRLDVEEIWSKLEAISDESKKYVAFRHSESSMLFQNNALNFENTYWQDTGIVAFYIMRDRIYCVLIIPSSDVSIVKSIGLSSQDFYGFVNSFQSEIVLRNDLSGDHYWQKLGDYLFSDISKQLSSVKRLCIIPSGDLYHLPIHAMTIKGKPIIDEWEVFYAPSLKVLKVASSRTKRRSNNLIMGYAPSNSSPSFKKAIEDETFEVAKTLNANPLFGEVAKGDLLDQFAEDSDIIHIAGHGVFNDDVPLQSGISLSDGVITAEKWLNLSLNADLVTLSACQTGVSNIRLGDELVGLSRSVLLAGASSLITSLWQINGDSTRYWMSSFYKSWQRSGSASNKASAFRSATLAAKKDYEDPYYWAPFVLLGDPS